MSIIQHDSLMMVVSSARNLDWRLVNTDTKEALTVSDFLAQDFSEVVKWSIGEGTYIPLGITGQQVGPIWKVKTKVAQQAIRTRRRAVA